MRKDNAWTFSFLLWALSIYNEISSEHLVFLTPYIQRSLDFFQQRSVDSTNIISDLLRKDNSLWYEELATVGLDALLFLPVIYNFTELLKIKIEINSDHYMTSLRGNMQYGAWQNQRFASSSRCLLSFLQAFILWFDFGLTDSIWATIIFLTRSGSGTHDSRSLLSLK